MRAERRLDTPRGVGEFMAAPGAAHPPGVLGARSSCCSRSTARPVLHNPRHLLMFFTLNEYLRFSLPAQVNVVYWSLTVEWHFYLLVPLARVADDRGVGRWPMLAGVPRRSASCGGRTSPPMQLPQGFVFGHLDQFVAGAIVGELVVAHAAGARSAIVRVARQPMRSGSPTALGAAGARRPTTARRSARAAATASIRCCIRCSGCSRRRGSCTSSTRSRRPWLEHRGAARARADQLQPVPLALPDPAPRHPVGDAGSNRCRRRSGCR